MGGVPSIPTDRSRTLQFIGAGVSRTGTLSMATALDRLLDGPVKHGGTHLIQREDAYAKTWVEIMDNRHDKPRVMKLLRKVTAGYVGLTDVPGIYFLPELMELYPDAKVILVTRDPQRWYQSIEPILTDTAINPWISYVLFAPCPTWRWVPQLAQGIKDLLIGVCGGGATNQDSILLYNDWVRAQVPKDKLLTMELSQGWEPLCKFVGKPVPDEPFPHCNESKDREAITSQIFWTIGWIWAGIFGVVGISVWGFLLYWRNN